MKDEDIISLAKIKTEEQEYTIATKQPLLNSYLNENSRHNAHDEINHLLHRNAEKRILKQFDDANNLILVGPRGAGKTSLLYEMKNQLKNRNDREAIFVDGQSGTGYLGYDILDRSDNLPENLNLRILKTEQFKKTLDGEKRPALFSLDQFNKILDTIFELVANSDYPITIFIDDAHCYDNETYTKHYSFHYLISRLVRSNFHNKLQIVTAMRNLDISKFDGLNVLLGQDFTVLELLPLTKAEIKSYLQVILQDSDLKEEAIKNISTEIADLMSGNYFRQIRGLINYLYMEDIKTKKSIRNKFELFLDRQYQDLIIDFNQIFGQKNQSVESLLSKIVSSAQFGDPIILDEQKQSMQSLYLSESVFFKIEHPNHLSNQDFSKSTPLTFTNLIIYNWLKGRIK